MFLSAFVYCFNFGAVEQHCSMAWSTRTFETVEECRLDNSTVGRMWVQTRQPGSVVVFADCIPLAYVPPGEDV